MERRIAELVIPILQESSKDIRIWRNGHIYYRIDGNIERTIQSEEREDQLYLIITWNDRGKENETEIPTALLTKVTIAKNINLEYLTEYYSPSI